MRWFYVGAIVAATCASDLLLAWSGKRQGEVSSASALAKLLRQWPVIAAVGFMALSFGAFVLLLREADLSFAVPVTAATIVVETLLARIVLKEKVTFRRWIGSALVACGVLLLTQS